MNKKRLIDANELKDLINGQEEFTDWQAREICEYIDCCDTAYDIDKVVERLKKAQKDPNLYVYAWDAYDKAIEIVKGGAV